MGTSMPTIKSFRPILLTAVTFFKNAPFFTNKILFFKNLILKLKYIKIKKKKKKKREKKQKRGVAEPPPWPKGRPATPYGVVRPPLYFFFFFIDLTGWPDRPIWGWPNHPHGLRGWPSHPFKSMKKNNNNRAGLGMAEPPPWPKGCQPPPMGWFGHPSFFFLFFFFFFFFNFNIFYF
jgi:hypothetical protein